MNTYELGDLVLLDNTYTVDGQPANPTSATLTIAPPGQAPVTLHWPTPAELAVLGVGEFEYPYSPSVPGLYAYTWAGTGFAEGARTAYFEVRPAYSDPGRFCSPADLEDFLQLSLSNDRAALRAIDSATAAIRNYCGQYLSYVADDSVTLRTTGQRSLLLPEQPVQAVGAVVENGNALVYLSDFDWSSDGLLYRLNFAGWRLASTTLGAFGAVQVTYSHGYPTIPEPVREVAIRIASRAYQAGLRTQALRGVSGLQSEQLPDYQVTYQADTATGMSNLGASAAPLLPLPTERTMLDPYRMKP